MIPKPGSASPTTTLRTPRPALVACGALALAAIAAVVCYVSGAPPAGTVTVAGLLLVAGFTWAQRGWQELRGRRRTADRWLLWGAEARAASELLAWRAAELTGFRSRKILARSLRRLGREAEGRLVPGALPLNRLEIRSQIGLLRALESRLADLGRSVTPRGVLLVERVLTEPGSPLYAHGQRDQLAQMLSEACAALEPLPGSATMDFPATAGAALGAERLGAESHHLVWARGR